MHGKVPSATKAIHREDVDQLTELAAHELCKIWGYAPYNPCGDDSIQLINARQAMATWRQCNEAINRAMSTQNDIETEIFNDE